MIYAKLVALLAVMIALYFFVRKFFVYIVILIVLGGIGFAYYTVHYQHKPLTIPTTSAVPGKL